MCSLELLKNQSGKNEMEKEDVCMKREAGSFLIEGGGMIFQKTGERMCWYFYNLADLFN